MIAPWVVACLGLSQLIAWGTTYYMIGAFGEAIVADLGWSREAVYGGFSLALVVMGLTSGRTGGLIDRHGGRTVMVAGVCVNAAGCLAISLARDPVTYGLAWVVLGVGMRMSLYDAAFATLARIAGAAARRPIAQITLLGGLASSVFWPVGGLLLSHYGWRGGALAYAAINLAVVPLLLALPRGGTRAPQPSGTSVQEAGARQPRPMLCALLYALIIVAANALNSAMSAHMIAILSGLGLGAAAAVSVASLRGVGQSGARLMEVLFGRRLHPLMLTLVATTILPAGLIMGFAARDAWAGAVFALAYGAGTGLLTIVRGTLPLVLFDPATYGRHVGRLIAPSFIVAAGAPLAFAALISRYGAEGALAAAVAIAATATAAAVALYMLRRP